MLRRAPSLTDQVKNHLKDMIIRGEFADGRVPPEMELAEALGVSRTTIRDALSRLEMEGAISRRQGAGTFVNDPVLQIRSRLDEIWSYEAMLQAHGFTPSTHVLESRVYTVGDPQLDPAIAETLSLADGEQVLFISKLFQEDNVPVILAYNYLPLRLTTEHTRRPIWIFPSMTFWSASAAIVWPTIFPRSSLSMSTPPWPPLCRSKVACRCFPSTRPATTMRASRS